MKRANRAGFTLVEVLTVIAIIALLAALILGLASNAQKKAARSKAEAEIAQWESFITDYQMKYGQVPGVVDANEDVTALKDALAAANHSLSNFVDPWGVTNHYFKSSAATFYLWSTGGATNDADRAMYIGTPKPQ